MLRGYRGYISKARHLARLRRAADSREHTDDSRPSPKPKEDDKAEPATIKDGKPKRPPSTKAETVIALFTGALLVVAVVAAYATWLQWEAANKSLKFAKQSASDAGNDTRAALVISDRIAEATENQSVYTREALGASDRIAAANERAAGIYDADLRLKRAVDLDIADETHAFDAKINAWWTMFQVKNIGGSAIRNARVYELGTMLPLKDIDKVWLHVVRGPNDFDISPGADHTFPVVAGRFPNDFFLVATNQMVIVNAIKIVFVDGNGDTQERRGCVYYIDLYQHRNCDKN